MHLLQKIHAAEVSGFAVLMGTALWGIALMVCYAVTGQLCMAMFIPLWLICTAIAATFGFYLAKDLL